MIKVLKNVLTPEYLELKRTVLSENFNWFYGASMPSSHPCEEGHIHMPYYRHGFLTRPEIMGFQGVESPHAEKNILVLHQILQSNNLFRPNGYFFLRSCANCTHPDQNGQLSAPHVDHEFPHWNLLIYLEGGGRTFVEGEEHIPKEDDIILFKGKHYMERPKTDRRVVLVSTIFEININN